MGRVTELSVQSPRQLLEVLELTGFEEYQVEFAELLAASPDLLVEDWSTEPELLEVFYCWVRCKRPHTIVEIGAYKGKAAFVFASAQKQNNYGEFYTIDNNEEGTVPEARARLDTLARPEKIKLLECSSQEAFKEWVRAGIDLLYIDGSHDYLDAAGDFALWSRHVEEEGGLIAMHDTMFRLERRFPYDYVYPRKYYDVLHVTHMAIRPSGHEWKGVGFVMVSGEFRTRE